jgi:hypothetical protein
VKVYSPEIGPAQWGGCAAAGASILTVCAEPQGERSLR